MKKAFSFLIIAAMIVTLCAVCVSAADPSLKLTKTVYAEGEEVIAIASGDGTKEWIGVYKKNEKPGAELSRSSGITSRTSTESRQTLQRTR